ncbi:MAG TPA: septal ring lytic transglycosylase RlpA family protein [Rectinemataceae bacterium]|nr:septal ring lytic transglycosylase RlpA family protein [Rectinemataceae bacterium]
MRRFRGRSASIAAVAATILFLAADPGALAQASLEAPLSDVSSLNPGADSLPSMPSSAGLAPLSGEAAPPRASGGAQPQAAGASAPLAYGSVFEGRASWYNAGFAGKRTASGEIYDPEGLTAAHRSLPFGSFLRVTDLDTGASVVVRINDRGPFVGDRILDLSEAAARLIGLLPAGTAMVRCELLRPEDTAAFGEPPKAPSPRLGGATAAISPIPAERLCRIQIASYSSQANAAATLERLRLSGISASIELAGPWKRVVLSGVLESEIDALTARLAALGYRGILVSYSP